MATDDLPVQRQIVPPPGLPSPLDLPPVLSSLHAAQMPHHAARWRRLC